MNVFQNPYLNPYAAIQQPNLQGTAISFANPQQVVRVNGENGAKSYQLGANSSALLLDESGLLVWLVTSDGAGYKTVSAYDITPHQAAQAPDLNSLESRISKLEEIVNGNARNTAADRKKQSDSSVRKTDDRNGQQCSEP